MESRSAGANHLIKEGALLTESAEDILNVLSMVRQRTIPLQKTLELPLDKPKNSVNIQKHNKSSVADDEKTVAEPQVALIVLISYEGVDIDARLRQYTGDRAHGALFVFRINGKLTDHYSYPCFLRARPAL